MLIVQKYGGSSLASMSQLQKVAEKVSATINAGDDVVVVVSAMGDTTDELLSKVAHVGGDASPREIDALLATGERQSAALMAMALEAIGIRAESFSGLQAGIRTDDQHRDARILEIHPAALREALDHKVTPVVTGFQGYASDGSPTTLGRGGSDLTAIALAARLDADQCHIYSDVAGVYTADPRIVPLARPLAELGYDEMLELASQGAQVLQTRAVLYAQSAQVRLEARSTFHDVPGTRVSSAPSTAWGPVASVALDTAITKIGLVGVPDAPGVAATLCGRLADQGINIDLVFQALAHGDQHTDMAFTVADQDVDRAVNVARTVLKELRGRDLVVDAGVAKVSAVGAGVRNHAGVAATMFRALADGKVNIQMIGTSEIKISCIIDRLSAGEALNLVHSAFGLGDETP